MNKPFKIYYNDQGQITTITIEDLPGNFVTVDVEQYNEIVQNISRYQILDGNLINIKKIKFEPPSLQFCEDFDTAKSDVCYMVEKNNLFFCEQTVTIKPTDFDNTKYSWVKYDS